MIDTSEQRQVLDMLEDGRIEAQDAERLLARLAETGRDAASASPNGATAARAAASPSDLHLHVVAHTEDGDEIDVRIPLRLVATGVDFEKLMPEAAREAVENTGIELSELRNLRGDQLIEAIQDLEVDMDDHEGNRVSIRCD